MNVRSPAEPHETEAAILREVLARYQATADVI